jgi:hypothetical protein
VSELEELKARVAKLEATIQDQEAREHFLHLPKHWLGDVERKIVPGMETLLPKIEQMVTSVELLVAKYGPTLRIGG